MFFTIRRFLMDAQMLFLPKSGSGKVGTLGADGDFGPPSKVRLLMQIVLTFALLGVSVWIIRDSSLAPSSHKWAHTGLGIILGYWFR